MGRCPRCGKPVEVWAWACTHCGLSAAQAASGRWKGAHHEWLQSVRNGVLVVVGAAAFVAYWLYIDPR